MRRRLLDWAVATSTRLDGFDVVLGVLTGGALLAPLAARLLDVPCVLSVRVSRYADDIYSPLGFAKVAVAQLCGNHDARYMAS